MSVERHDPEEPRARALFIEHARGQHVDVMRLDCPSCRKLGFALWEVRARMDGDQP